MNSDSDNNNLDNSSAEMDMDLSPEVFGKIRALQEKHDLEIELLANELNLQPYFIKSVMKDYRAPATKKPRRISGFNMWQISWWEKEGKGLNIKNQNAQQMCANSWKELDNDTRIYFENEAKKIKCLKDNESYISNAKARKSKLDKAIEEMRKMFRTLQVTCGMEFVAIMVSNNNELRSHYFGSSIGEAFYNEYNILSDAIIPFRCFSILKKKENEGVIKCISNTEPESETQHDIESEPKIINPVSVYTNNINFAKPNSIDTRNKVRAILREKFKEDVQGEIIPYKNWKEQPLYKIVGWPLNVEFKDYANLNGNERLEVLKSLNAIRFEFQ